MEITTVKYRKAVFFLRFLILFVFLCNKSYSQNTGNNKISDKELSKLIELAESSSNNLSDSSLSSVNKALSYISDYNSLNYIKLLKYKGKAFYHLNETDSALKYFNLMRDISKKQSNIKLEAYALKLLALTYKNLGNYYKAITVSKECINLCKDANIPTIAFSAMNNLGIFYENIGNYRQSLDIHLETLKKHKELKDTAGMIASLSNLGVIYEKLDEYDLAYSYYLKALGIANKTNRIEDKSKVYLNMGVIHKEKKEYKKALKIFFKSLEITKTVNKEYESGLIYEDIANLYSLIKKYKKATAYYNDAYLIYMKYGTFRDKVVINVEIANNLIADDQLILAKTHLIEADSLINIKSKQFFLPDFYKTYSLYYETIGSHIKALAYYKQYKLAEDSLSTNELNEKIAKQKANFDFATQKTELEKLNAETELIKIREKQQKQELETNKFIILGVLLILLIGFISFFIVGIQLKKNKKANLLLQQQRDLLSNKNSKIIKQNEEIKKQTEKVYEINDDLMQLKTAIDETENAVVILDKDGNFEWGNRGFDKLYDIKFDDFIKKHPNILDATKKSNNSELISTVIKKCIKDKTSGSYEFSTVNKNGDKIWIQTNIKAVTDISDKIISLIVIDTNITEQVEIGRLLEQKNYKLEIQKEEIDSSLRYAQNIQNAILPASITMRKDNDFFLIYLPKDIVSGDFYWFFDSKNSPYTFFAVVDCTGHGVPGAFMSMIGARLLNLIVTEKQITDPAEILEELHTSVNKTLNQRDTGNKDGMDISLCRFENIGDTKEVVFSGAKQSIYYSKDNKLFKIRGDIKTIGGHYHDDVSFTNKKITLVKNDMIYMLTDGYIDQHSYTDGKKIGSQKTFELLSEIINLSLKEQKEILIDYLINHKKNVSQRDDITFLGIKID